LGAVAPSVGYAEFGSAWTAGWCGYDEGTNSARFYISGSEGNLQPGSVSSLSLMMPSCCTLNKQEQQCANSLT
jgi:hypothetical protein